MLILIWNILYMHTAVFIAITHIVWWKTILQYLKKFAQVLKRLQTFQFNMSPGCKPFMFSFTKPYFPCPPSGVKGRARSRQYLYRSSAWYWRPVHRLCSAGSVHGPPARHGCSCLGFCWWASAHPHRPSRAPSLSPSKLKVTSPSAGSSPYTLEDLLVSPAVRSREKRGSIDWKPCCTPWTRLTATPTSCPTSRWEHGSWTPAPETPTPWSSRSPLSRPSFRRTTQTCAVQMGNPPSSPNQRGWSEWSGPLAALCPSWWPMCSDCLRWDFLVSSA